MSKKTSLFPLLLGAFLVSACSESELQTADIHTPEVQSEVAVENTVMTEQQALETEIALGSATKRLCSSVLVSGRTSEHVMAEELNNPALAAVTFSIDGDLVTSSQDGLTIQALYRPYIGCTLIKDKDAGTLRAEFDANRFAAPPASPDEHWPVGNQVELPTELEGVDLAAINLAVDIAFKDLEPDQNINTRAVIVIHKGRIIAEKYAAPFHADMPQLGWSMTKTVTGALTGMLVADGELNISAPAPVPEWQGDNDPRAEITLNNLLQMSSGLQFSEVYTAGSMSDVILMLYTIGDTGAFTANKPLAHPPGTNFYYSSGTTNIISRIQHDLFSDWHDYLNFPHQRLFQKLNMDSAVIEPDESGVYVGSSYMYATPRDWAKLGLLFLQKGEWAGEQILSPEWVEYSLTPATAPERGNYGNQIWLNAGAPGNPENRAVAALPASMYYLSGFEGQNVVVLPDQELIVVRMGVTTRGQRPIWNLTKAVLNAL